jgi:hypothetical protein
MICLRKYSAEAVERVRSHWSQDDRRDILGRAHACSQLRMQCQADGFPDI